MIKSALALATVSLLVLTLVVPRSGADVTVVSLFQTPESPTPDDNVTVTLEVTNSSEVNKTYISWCQSSPELCFTPRQMKYIGQDTYSLDIGRFADGLEMKYNITIVYKNGTSSVTQTVHFKVQKATNGDGGDNNNTTGNNDTDGNGTTSGGSGPNYMLYGAVVAVIFIVIILAAVVAMRRKKPGSP